MSLSVKAFYQNNKIPLLAALISALFSIIAYSNHNPLNYDGILYLTVASTYLKSGFNAALAAYPWPFYSILIAWISKLTHLSLQHTAEGLNNLFLMIVTVAFINLIKKIKDTPTLQIAAAITILAFPALNHYRDLIVRDFGYWAFFLIALNQLLKYLQNPNWRHALTWMLSLLCATLFRIEGAILFMLTPFALLLCPDQAFMQRLTNLIKLYCLPLLSLALYLTWHHLHSPHTSAEIGRISELANQFTQGGHAILNNFQTKIALIKNNLPIYAAAGDAKNWLIFGFTGVFIQAVISTLSLLFTLLFIYAIIKRLTPRANATYAIAYVALINIFIALAFFAQNLFLSDRYLMASCLVLIIWPVFSLEALYQQWRQHNNRWPCWLVAIWLCLAAFGSVISFGYSKAYITEAGLWLKNNTPIQTTVYSNNKQLLFYSERTEIDWQNRYDDSNPLNTLQHVNWRTYNYLAIRIKHEDAQQETAIIKLIGQNPSKIFANKRGDKVLIFKLQVGN